MLTFEEAKRLFDYDPETGVVRWRVKTCRKVVVGAEAGTLKTNHRTGKTYRHIRFRGKDHKAHRIIYLLQTSEWPPDDIDHLNGDGVDNRWENLRAATRLENSRNQRRLRNNTSGQTGVYWHEQNGKWVAQIMVHKRNIYLGYFTSKEEAIAARKEAEIEHNFHPNHGTDRPL
jgi:hypothetical protein